MIRKKIHKIIFFFLQAQNIHMQQYIHWARTLAWATSLAFVWLEVYIFFSTITIAAVVVCLSIFFLWNADCGSEWDRMNVTCTRKGLTSANLNGRFELTENATHARTTLSWLCALLCIVLSTFSPVYVFNARSRSAALKKVSWIY